MDPIIVVAVALGLIILILAILAYALAQAAGKEPPMLSEQPRERKRECAHERCPHRCSAYCRDPKGAQPQPRGEKARVADPTPCDRCGNPIGIVWFADNSLFNEITGTVGVGMLCPTCFDHLAAPRLLTWKAAPVGEQELAAPPRGEGDDLAARLEAEACNIDAAIYDGLPSELRAERVGRRSAFREAAEMARASAQPEQPRGEEADGTLLLAIHYSGDHNPEQDRFAILDALPVEWPSGALLEEAEFIPAPPRGEEARAYERESGTSSPATMKVRPADLPSRLMCMADEEHLDISDRAALREAASRLRTSTEGPGETSSAPFSLRIRDRINAELRRGVPIDDLLGPAPPRGEEAGVNPFNDTTGEGSPLTTGLFRRTVDQVGNLDARREAAPPRGEGDDLDELATLLEGWADEPPSERKDWFLMAGHLREAAYALRASTHPEQSARIVGAALDLLDSLGAPHYHDLIGMTYTLRKEQADNLRAALEQEDD